MPVFWCLQCKLPFTEEEARAKTCPICGGPLKERSQDARSHPPEVAPTPAAFDKTTPPRPLADPVRVIRSVLGWLMVIDLAAAVGLVLWTLAVLPPRTPDKNFYVLLNGVS